MIPYKTSKHAKILFVGINPHSGSYRRGVPFSNNKMFWYLLNRAGLLQETEKDLSNDQSLKRIYEKKFLPEYGLNFVNLVDRPTVDVTLLKKGEEEAGIRRALKSFGAADRASFALSAKSPSTPFIGHANPTGAGKPKSTAFQSISCIFRSAARHLSASKS
jgi:G:T/U-mismatch repair DNA glycosylase